MIRPLKIALLLFCIHSSETDCFSFQQTLIKGTVKDSTGMPVEKATVTIASLKTGTYTDTGGNYSFSVPLNTQEITIVFACVGYRNESRTVKCDRGEIVINIILSEEIGSIGEVTVVSERIPADNSLTRIPVKDLKLLPSASGSFEAVIKTMPGVASNNELSSQYSVRGGNYDENLVYVNDIEVFKPFLIRSGQQEGLSFINPDLISSVSFSSGGFGASYGDKMSSVLDISYKTPVRNRGSVSLGLLSSSAHLEGVSKNRKFTWLAGTRYRSTRMMLNTLDSEGDYQPVFLDIQTLFSYKTSKNSRLSLLTTYSSNTYNYIPQSRSSTFGTESMAYQLYVLFEGAERDNYHTLNAVLSWELTDRVNINHKFLISSYVTGEEESFDIRGYYSLSTLDKNAGSENFSDTLMNIGIGSFLSHARNRLSAVIQAASYKGDKNFGKLRMDWGVRLRHDKIDDRIKEWTKVDSAGFSLPKNSDYLLMSSLINADNCVSNLLGESYIELARPVKAGGKDILFNGGIRGTFNSFTDEFFLSPRISAMIKQSKNLSFRIAGGVYYQPPFYREMRFPNGSINMNIKSQRSFHMVAGAIYDFMAWDRPFRFSAEVYNKLLRNIIPYKLDNVRLIYSGENSAEGYTRGIDLRLNGEFVQDAESWISLSYMDSKLKIPGQIEDYFPSPFDQTFSANIFFQDYLPGYPTWRAHINLTYATGLPIVSPYNNKYNEYFRLPDYRRIDLGITKVIKGKNAIGASGGFLSHFEEVVAGMEVFNLLDINNTVSYFWIKTINNLSGKSRQFAIPNYLTGRSLNFKIMASF